MSDFVLHPALRADTLVLGDLPLCTALLMNNRYYPWLILVPRRAGMRELHELAVEGQHQLLTESARVAEVMQRLFRPDKLNVAVLGNVVPQLHWHIVARFATDPAWPSPVWGTGGEPYDKVALETLAERLRTGLFP